MTSRGLLAYAALGLPLAMAALPIYLAAPRLYGNELGLNLAWLGLVLLLTRFVDTVQDPWLGRLVDAWHGRSHGWHRLILVGSAGLGLGFYALFNPPMMTTGLLYAWLASSLALVYFSHSLVNICYLAWGARLTDSVTGRARVTAWREAAGLLGVILAALLPAVLAMHFSAQASRQLFALLFAAILLAASYLTLCQAPPPLPPAKRAFGPHAWRYALRDSALRQFYLIYLLNSLSVAIPATLVLFFIDDVIGASARAGLFLTGYFVSGAIALPLWVRLSDRIGKSRAWLGGMLLASAAFIGAASLGQGDDTRFMLICILSGVALGADLALPAAMLADAIPAAQRESTGMYFGIWALLGKLALALSAGIGLPLLSLLGYQPGIPDTAGGLALIYAGLPCLIKLLSAGLLLRWQHRWPAPAQPLELKP
ncbi:MFS transporter [Chitinimonas naiadis]